MGCFARHLHRSLCNRVSVGVVDDVSDRFIGPRDVENLIAIAMLVWGWSASPEVRDAAYDRVTTSPKPLTVPGRLIKSPLRHGYVASDMNFTAPLRRLFQPRACGFHRKFRTAKVALARILL